MNTPKDTDMSTYNLETVLLPNCSYTSLNRCEVETNKSYPSPIQTPSSRNQTPSYFYEANATLFLLPLISAVTIIVFFVSIKEHSI